VEGSTGCLGVAVGASATVSAAASFVYWRRGLVEIGASDGWSWPLAIAGTVLFLGTTFGVSHMFTVIDDDDIGRALLVAAPVVVGLGWGYLTILRHGGAPAWILDPPEIYELVWKDPPWPVRALLSTVLGPIAWGSLEGARKRR